MSKREKILASLVGVLVLAFAGSYAVQQFGGIYTTREAQIEALRSELTQKKRDLGRALEATGRLVRYEEQSLPGNTEVARTAYQSWLWELAAECGFQDVDVKSNSYPDSKKRFNRLRFTLSARADVQRLTQFLYKFYRRDLLHRIQYSQIRPQLGTKGLIIDLAVEALSLPGANESEVLYAGDSSDLAMATLAEYEQAVVQRNPFGFPNQPPELDRVSSKSTYVKRSFSVSLSGKDPDKDNRVSYRFAGDVPEGATIDSKTGSIRWTPKETGSFKMEVEAFDDGFPSKRVFQSFQVAVREPPPPRPPSKPRDPPKPPSKPKFDVAKHTVLTSIVEVDGNSEAWLLEKTTGVKHTLKIGDQFSIGSLKGKVSEIGLEEVQVDVDGKRFLISVGDTLVELYEIPSGGV